MALAGRFAVLLREGREAAGLSQAALAARCRLTGSYISLLESGSKPPPSDRVVRRLATALGLDADRALEVAHLERAPADLRRALESLRRRERIERELREETAAILFPISLWNLFTAGGGPGSPARGPAPVPPGVVRALDALQDAAREAPDMAAFRAAADGVLAALPPEDRRRLLEAAPLLAEQGSEPAAFLVTAPEPGLPPEILAGDTLVVDPRLEPRDGDPVLVGAGDAPGLARFSRGVPAVRGVVVEVRRRMR